MAQLIMGHGVSGCFRTRLAPGGLGCGVGVCGLDGDKYSCRLLDANELNHGIRVSLGSRMRHQI